MRFVIELILLIILFYSTWHGYRRGAVNAAISLAVFAISVLGALLISSCAADNAAYVLRPFVAGGIDTQYEAQAAENIGIGDVHIEESLAERPELVRAYAKECLMGIGFSEKRAEHYSLDAERIYGETELDATTAAAHAASGAIAYMLFALVLFGLIRLAFSVIMQVFDLRFRITDNADLDLYGGAALGFLRGFFCCVFVCWVLSFCGIIIGKTTLDDGVFSRFFMLLDTAADRIF